MHFVLCSQLITNPSAAALEQGMKPPAVLLAIRPHPGALILSCGKVNLEFLAAEWPSVQVVVVTQQAVLACSSSSLGYV